MAYPTTAGWPAMGMYIPPVFPTKLLVEFYAATCLSDITNHDYEGEVKKFGDTINIRTLPDMVSYEYEIGQDLRSQTPNGSYVQILLNKGRYFQIPFNTVEEFQSDIAYRGQWAKHAAETTKRDIERAFFGDIYSDASAYNAGATAGAISGDIDLGSTGSPLEITRLNIIETILNCGLALDEQDVPPDGWYIVLPNWAVMLLKDSDLRDASLTGDGMSTLRTGRVGVIDRFTVYGSNMLSSVSDTTTCFNCLFGQKDCIAFCSQIVQTETLPNPFDFGMLLRSLNVYGYKAIKPEGVGHLYITKGS